MSIKKYLAGALSMLPLAVFAQVEIPLAEKVAEETENMSIWDFGIYFIAGIGGLILLGLGVYALIQTGYAALTAVNDWRMGKAEFGEMAIKVGVALAVLVLIFIIIGFGWAQIK